MLQVVTGKAEFAYFEGRHSVLVAVEPCEDESDADGILHAGPWAVVGNTAAAVVTASMLTTTKEVCARDILYICVCVRRAYAYAARSCRRSCLSERERATLNTDEESMRWKQERG